MEGIRINASGGDVWVATAGQIGLVAGNLGVALRKALEQVLGVRLRYTQQHLRLLRALRLRFYNDLFMGADYGIWVRQQPIRSTRELTLAEASAILDFLDGADAVGVLAQWAGEVLAPYGQE